MSTRPQTTMMIQARTPERTLQLVKRGIEGGADAFGWQLEQLQVCYHTEEVFREVLCAMGDRPCYVTNYRDHLNEGRDAHILADELVTAARCGAKLIDVMGDMFCPTRYQITEQAQAVAQQRELIERIHQAGARVLISSHTYCYLPEDEVLRIAQLQQTHGADVVKIVTAADNEGELLHNFEITAKLKATLSCEFLFLCVGSMCRTHRRLAPMMAGGMFLCVAEHDELATPAQPLLADARILIDTVFPQ